MDDLRRLLVGPEQGRIEKLEERPVVSADAVAHVLPEAANGALRDELAIALEPPMTMAIRRLARREADLFGEILSPTIGAAVRKAVADAMAALMEKFNEALERSLSLRSLQWRLEARRTGRPFAEVVLLRTLLYRVQEVFLIHPHTGLVLERVAAEGAGVLQPDQVASMLEAIDSFMREAFAPLPKAVHVARIEFGDQFLWVDRSPELAIAALVRGVAPRSFGDLLRETRERIYLLTREELARFQSNVAPFAITRPLLERCLTAQRRPAPKRAHLVLALLATLIVTAAALLAVRHHAQARAERRTMDASVAAFASQPGIVVTSAQWSKGRLRIQGLRDPLAASPSEILAAHGLPRADVRMVPYSSLDQNIVQRRAERKLSPPPGVSLALVGDVLHARGVAARSWVEQARRVAPTITGVDHYDDTGLRTQEDLASLTNAASALERARVAFPPTSSDARLASGLKQARQAASQVNAAAAAAKTVTCLSLVGHADARGPDALNQTLSEARANAVAGDFAAHGIPRDRLRPSGAGVWAAAGSASAARSVTFHVDLNCKGPP